MYPETNSRLILASQSKARADILRNAGLNIETKPAEIDEGTVREAMFGSDPADVAEVLARLKADAISQQSQDALVIGADQILACEGNIFEKPPGMDEARATLLSLRGKTHELISAVAISKNGETTWTHVESAQLTMRDLPPETVGKYLAAAGEKVCRSVGAYQLEGLGIHLFSKIDGDFFTILGLPLIPLLSELREKKIIAS